MTQQQVFAILRAYSRAAQSHQENYKSALGKALGEDLFKSSASEDVQNKIIDLINQGIAHDLVNDVDVNHPISEEELDRLVTFIMNEIEARATDPAPETVRKPAEKVMKQIFRNLYFQIRNATSVSTYGNKEYWKLIGTITELAVQNGSTPDNFRFVDFIYDDIVRATRTKTEFVDSTTTAMSSLLDEDKFFETILEPIFAILGETLGQEMDDVPQSFIDEQIEEIRQKAVTELKPKITETFRKARECTNQWINTEADRIFGTSPA